MEKRSRRCIRDLVAQPASLGLSENEIGCARISMVARNTNVPFKGRIQKRKTYHLQIITFRLQRAAGTYKSPKLFDHPVGADQEGLGDGQPERLRGRKVDDEIELNGLFDWKIRRLRAAQNSINITGSASE